MQSALFCDLIITSLNTYCISSFVIHKLPQHMFCYGSGQAEQKYTTYGNKPIFILLYVGKTSYGTFVKKNREQNMWKEPGNCYIMSLTNSAA